MAGFSSWAVIQRLHDNTGRFRLVKDLVYTTEAGSVYTVPKGFKTDLASIPQWLWSMLPSHGLYLSASILHDYFCESDFISRKDGDKLFLEAMKYSNVLKFKRHIIYYAVRVYAIMCRIP